MRALTTLAVFCGALVLFYGIPTVVEFVLAPHVGYWIAAVVLGDLAGCTFLFAIGLKRLGLAVYFGMGAVESAILGWHLLPITTAVWVADVVPALIAAGVLSVGANLLADTAESTRR